MKRILMATIVLTMFAAPAAMAQSHHNRDGVHNGYRGGHTAQRYDSHGYQQRWNSPHGTRSNWGYQSGGYGYNDHRPRGDHLERRSHHRPRHHR